MKQRKVLNDIFFEALSFFSIHISIYPSRRFVNGIILVLLLSACSTKDMPDDIAIEWSDDKATGIFIPESLLADVPHDSINNLLTIRLNGSNESILGEYVHGNSGISFRPAIPFTHGLRYTVAVRDRQIYEVTIPVSDAATTPVLLSVYPTPDTLPENLLKVYLRFSEPMQAGRSFDNVLLVRNETDTIHSPFLNLQPELWNSEQTLLTLWLDPGRIKRDLKPNILLGAPLEKGAHYQLIISHHWKSTHGVPLSEDHIKYFFTIPRDSILPDPLRWKMKVPASGTNQPLSIAFSETLDYSLLQSTLGIIMEGGDPIEGTIVLEAKEKGIQFIPATTWTRGNYKLRIETRLEDLAGNNINRPFDRDLTQTSSGSTSTVVERPFRIK